MAGNVPDARAALEASIPRNRIHLLQVFQGGNCWFGFCWGISWERWGCGSVSEHLAQLRQSCFTDVGGVLDFLNCNLQTVGACWVEKAGAVGIGGAEAEGTIGKHFIANVANCFLAFWLFAGFP